MDTVEAHGRIFLASGGWVSIRIVDTPERIMDALAPYCAEWSYIDASGVEYHEETAAYVASGS